MLTFLLFACQNETKTDKTITWTKDVQPIVEQHCTRCHEEGGQGTGDFTRFETVDAMANLIQNAIQEGTMPPPAADPSCHEYQDSDIFHMPDESKEIISQWIDAGKPYGDEADAQNYNRDMATIENPDLVVKLPEPYTPTFSDPNNPGNEYRCFAIPHNQTEPFYVTELHPLIDNSALVHHVVLAKGNDNGILDGSTDPKGVDCIEDGAFVTGDYQDSAMLSGWAPGMSPIRFPDGAGLLVKPNEYIVIQMHYFQSVEAGEGATDQSGYMFKTTTEMPENTVQMIPIGIHDFTIPAGDESYTISDSMSLPFELKLWGVFPHMHILGSGYSMGFEDECILESDQYDFNNQVTYMFEEPLTLPADTPIDFSCTWNNSTSNPYLIHNPPVDTYYGERTDEEMCYAFSLISF